MGLVKTVWGILGFIKAECGGYGLWDWRKTVWGILGFIKAECGGMVLGIGENGIVVYWDLLKQSVGVWSLGLAKTVWGYILLGVWIY